MNRCMIRKAWGLRYVCVVFTLAMLGCISIVAGCGADSIDKEVPARSPLSPIMVHTCMVQAGSNGQYLALSGVSEPVRRTTPAARMMARVLTADFKEGQRVAARQALVRLDTRDLDARLRQAQAALATALTAQDVAQLNLERMRKLYAEQTVSRSQLEKMEVAYAQAEATVAAAKSGRDELDVNLAYAVVSAPFDGVIVRKLVEEGAMVAPGQPLFILEDDSRLRVIAAIGADLAAGLKPGQTLPVMMGGEKAQGIIEGIVSTGQTQTPGLRVQLLIDNSSRRFPSGTIVTVETPGVQDAGAEILVPKTALVEQGRLTGVYVAARDSRAHLHWVITGESRGDTVTVLSGLKSGDRVVLHPEQSGVTDGAALAEIAR